MRGPRKSRYFLLSYAHTPPLPDQLDGELDQWVTRFFRDLSGLVTEKADLRSGIAGGFHDLDVPIEADRQAAFNEAMETAEVFVPLCSPAYFARNRTGREWACYQERLLQGGVSDPASRFLPVLWIPLPGSQERPELERALELGENSPAYRDLGLQGLARLQQYHTEYESITERLADRIVELAEESPVGPSSAPALDQVAGAFDPDQDSLSFSVAVAAPASDDLPPGAPRTAYGKDGTAWRAYEEHPLPLASYARDQAEMLDFSVTVSAVEAVPPSLGERPGVVLIDPWFVAHDDGSTRLRALLSGLPEWVLPVVVRDTPEDPRKAPLVAEVLDIVYSTGVNRRGPARAAVDNVTSLEAFVALMPFVVGEAERRYFRRDLIPSSARGAELLDDTSARPSRMP